MRAFASIHWRAASGLGPHFLDRRPNFSHCLSVSSGLLRLRATRASSAHLDETNVASSVLARAWHRSFPQQRARRYRGNFQSQIGFHADTEVRDRAKIAGVAELQIPAAKIGAAGRRTGFRHLFQLLRLVRNSSWAVPFGTVPAHVPRWLLLCLPFIAPAVVAEIQLRRAPLALSNSRVTKCVF